AGFSIQGAPTAGPGGNPAPMPVRWLYFLQDGTLCLLGDPRIDRQTNPIVGRVAFWTDDETNKVNLNTAGPATQESFWDMPRAASRIEEDRYAWFQPSQNEYTRYPGHPGMVSLRSILGNLGNLSADEYHRLSPRYRWGGSQDGTIRIDSGRTDLLLNKEDRPYATTDEFLFQSIGAGLQNFNGVLTPSTAASLGFFVTTTSRAPELNLFGQPRVSIWPLHAQNTATRRTPFDQLIARATTIGGKPYYFVREFPLSATKDFSDFERNQELYAYLQRLTGTPFPGFGNRSFLDKYNADRDQILTEIFDYIRSTNLNDTYNPTGGPGSIASYTPDLEVAVNSAVNHTASSPDKGAGFVVPIRIGSTQGGGRFPAATGAALWFCTHLENPAAAAGPGNRTMLSTLFLVKTCTPTFGFPLWKPSGFQVELANAPGTPLSVNVGGVVTPLFAGGTTAEIFAPPTANFGQGGGTSGGYDGAGWILYHLTIPAASPFLGASAEVPAGTSTFSILPGAIDIRFRVGGTTVQSYRFSFPEASGLPLPELANWDATYALPMSWWKARSQIRPLGPFDGDSLRSVELGHGDARLALMQATEEDDPYEGFRPHPDFASTTTRMAHSFGGVSTVSNPYLWPGGSSGSYAGLAHTSDAVNASGVGWNPPYRTMNRYFGPNILPDITDLRANGWSGDFDNGFSRWTDGPFLNLPDAGARSTSSGAAAAPYLVTEGWVRADGLFSPLRQVPSAVMFGSLPTGVKAGIPWRTLLFCPNPADAGHKGFEAPADHLLLDLFRMPVVEPIALSGPASTDGKINLNYRIAPFSYIRRASAWFALLEPMRIFSVPDTKSLRYKGSLIESFDYRTRLNVPETLLQFEERFNAGEIFRSSSEICSLFLVPNGATLAQARNLSAGWWKTRRLTGDNSREKPYAELYPKLTTQSNTYRIHMRVQSLTRSGGPPASGDFEPVAEYRGSALLERYLDPEDPRFSTVNPDTDCLNALYRFRVLERRQFVP
ncbi:MAG TPA: Verru_Chthon cassette protein A, partial [Terrimicrobiaceae bacterium]|nr:Verru_Chthon cassette protein A [Terrimicrobiaceae bacterium]